MIVGRAMPETDVLVGRERELAPLRDLLAGERDVARVVVGEPGVGRTALLRHLAHTAARRVVWVRGSRSEADLPYSAAAELFAELAAYVQKVPAARRRALEIAFALADGPMPRPLAVCLGAVGVVTAAARQEPLLVLVDDLQWVDQESRRLLEFLGRRLAGERVALVMTLREEPGVPPDLPDLPVLRLDGLDPEDCPRLARAHGLAAGADEVTAVAEAAGGNPLAVLEALSGSRTGDPDVDVGTVVLPVWRGALARLPDLTREALVAVAVAGPVGQATLEAVLKELGLSLRDLEPAEREGLLTADLRPRQRLLGPALLAAASVAIRKEVHLALAAHAGPEHEAWYRSLAMTGKDEELARRLAGLAERADEPTAARLLRRAAELTPAPEPRARRLLAAASAAFRSGQGERSVAWCREVATLPGDPETLAAAATLAGRALLGGGRHRHAHDELAAAAARLARRAPVAAAGLLSEAALPAMVMGEAGLAATAVSEAELLAEDVPPPPWSRLISLAARTMHGVSEPDGPPSLSELDGEPGALVLAALVHLWAERMDPARVAVTAAIDRLRRGGPPSLLALALAVRADLGVRVGSWSAAEADATAAVDGVPTRDGADALGLFVLARLAAARGDETCRPWLTRARARAGRYGVDLRLLLDPAARGLAALGAGEPGAAVEPLEAAWAHAVESGVRHPNVVPFAGDLAEAHARCGDRERAAQVVSWLAERAETLGLRAPLAAAWRCRGLLATDADTATAAFAAAHRAGDHRRAPFDHARTLLCEGEVLRRLRRPAAARSPLRHAVEIFEGLGATAWAGRAAAELSAAGDRGASSARPPDTGLTAQQLRIAGMVAAGHNNVETAEALFLSRKTVEAHLTQVYRKLGVHSRTQLAVALASLEGARDRDGAPGGG